MIIEALRPMVHIVAQTTKSVQQDFHGSIQYGSLQQILLIGDNVGVISSIQTIRSKFVADGSGHAGLYQFRRRATNLKDCL